MKVAISAAVKEKKERISEHAEKDPMQNALMSENELFFRAHDGKMKFGQNKLPIK